MNADAASEGRDAAQYQYELALLLKREEDLPGVATLLRQHNGETVGEPRAKKLALAYKIKGNTEAVFATCFFRASGVDVKQLENDLRTRPEVIRSMILRAAVQGVMPLAASPAVLPERPGRIVGSRTGIVREPKKQAPREPLSNEALENLLKEI